MNNVSVSRELMERVIRSAEALIEFDRGIFSGSDRQDQFTLKNAMRTQVLELQAALAQPSEQPAKAEQPGDVGGHRAEFLYGAADGSPEFHGYEFANGKTEEYRRMHWDALIAALAPSVPAEAVAWIIPGDDSARDDGSLDAMVYKTGEFTVPLYKHPAPPANDEAVKLLARIADFTDNIEIDEACPEYARKQAAALDKDIRAFLASQHEEKGNG